LELSVHYLGERTDELRGTRSQFAYEAALGSQRLTGDDLYSSVDADVTAARMLGTFASFLADAGERYRARMCPPDDDYPEWLYEQAYLDADELTMVSLELEDGHAVSTAAMSEAPQRWVSIVFQQGEDANHALALLDERGPESAIEYLLQWDYGKATELAARVNGHEYASPPSDAWSRQYRHGDYHVSWSHALGHIGLSRRLVNDPPTTAARMSPVADRRRLLGTPTPIATQAPPMVSRGPMSRD
jgi:hypothetical protein